MFTPKGFLCTVPLKPSRDSQRFRIWLRSVQFDSAVLCTLRSSTLRWDAHQGAWLRSGMLTAESDSEVGSTPRSLTPRCDAHSGFFWEIWCSWLHGVMHTGELNSMEGCTPQSQLHQISCFFVFITSFNNVLQKTSELKKVPLTIFDLKFNFHFNIFRHHRELHLYDAHCRVWLCCEKHIVESDSAVGCTPEFFEIFWSLVSGMRTTELDSAVWCTPQSLTLRGDAHHGAF